MTEQLKRDVELKVLQFIKGQTLEMNKFEIKKNWYDLSGKTKTLDGKQVRNKEFFEFLKDCTSIINSYGNEDGFIVIGIDEKSRTCYDTDVRDSNLNDSSQIKDVIISQVDKAFLIDISYIQINGKQLSVIHIPTSVDKPHLIQDYWSPKDHNSKNVIFVRNGSGTQVASRGDIDRMYYERIHVTLERKIEVSFAKYGEFKFERLSDSKLRMTSKMTFDNLGTRKLLVDTIYVALEFKGEEYLCMTPTFYFKKGLVLIPNEPFQREVEFYMLKLFSEKKQINEAKKLLNNGRLDIKVKYVKFLLTNHEQLLSIPRIDPRIN